MSVHAETIDQATLERLVDAGVVRGAAVVGHSGGWGIVVKYGTTECLLAAKRGSVRSFRKFETLVAFLKKIGISKYLVDAADFDSASLSVGRARPDAADRMKKTFAAKAYNDWLLEKLDASANDIRPRVPHEEVMGNAQAIINAAKHRAA